MGRGESPFFRRVPSPLPNTHLSLLLLFLRGNARVDDLDAEFGGVVRRAVKNDHEGNLSAGEDIGIGRHDVDLVGEGLLDVLLAEDLQLEQRQGRARKLLLGNQRVARGIVQ